MNIPENLLIVRTDRIGDLVLTLPLAEIVKKHYPKCKITFLVRNYTKEILYDHPYVDEVITLIENNNSKEISFTKNKVLINNKKFDTAVVVSPNIKIALILFFSGVRKRIGTGYRWYSFLFNDKVFVHRKYAAKHELEFNVELLTKIGVNESVNINNVDYSLQINENSRKKIDEILIADSINKSKPLFIIHPGSGSSSIDLPINKFRELTSAILSELNVEIIITGTKDEKYLCEQLVINDKIKNYAGKFNLSELIALIGKCDLFISNSTGPLHIASALNKNVVGFYPNLLTCSYKRWGPYSSKNKVFTPPLTCKKCEMEQCSNKECMNNIDIEEVIEYIKNRRNSYL